MSVAGPESHPQLFVVDMVDSQVPYTYLPRGGCRREPPTRQRLLLLLAGLALLGLIVEGGFLYHLYLHVPVAVTMMQTQLTQQKPSAHLSGSTSPEGSTSSEVIQWNNQPSVATFTYRMNYTDGRLIVLQQGFYYLYAKVCLVASRNCTYNGLKLRKRTNGYEDPIELITKRFSCHHGKPTIQETFVAGVFDLMTQDEIYVTLEGGNVNTESFMGAFMLY